MKMIGRILDVNIVGALALWINNKLVLVNLGCFLENLGVVKEVFLTISAILAAVWTFIKIYKAIKKKN